MRAKPHGADQRPTRVAIFDATAPSIHVEAGACLAWKRCGFSSRQADGIVVTSSILSSHH